MTSHSGTCFPKKAYLCNCRDSWVFRLLEAYISQPASRSHAILDNFLKPPGFPLGPPISQRNASCKRSGRVAPNPNASDLLEGSTNRTEQRKWGKPWRFFVGRLQVGDVDFVSCWRYTMDCGIVGLGFFQGIFGRDLSQIILRYLIESIISSQLLSNSRRSSDTQHYNKYHLHIDSFNWVAQPFPIWVVTL